MKRLSLTPDDTTYELILREAYSRLKDATPTGRAIQKKAVHNYDTVRSGLSRHRELIYRQASTAISRALISPS